MANKSAVKFNTRQFEKALAAFGKDAGKAGHKVIRNQLRLFIEKVARMQPPRTKGAGVGAIVKDVKSVLGAVDSLRALDALDETFGNRLHPLEFEPHEDKARRQVERHRNKRGRVKYKAQTVTLNGGKKWSKKMHTTNRIRNQILREKKAKVGTAKAGWKVAARRFKGRLPAWVMRHNAPGSGRDKFNERSGKGFVEGVNKVPHAARHSGIAAAVMRGRVRAMKSQLNKEMRAVGRKYSA